MRTFYKVCSKSTYYFLRLLYRHQIHLTSPLPSEGAIIAANHVSYLDPLLIGASYPEEIAYLAKEELFRFPLFRSLLHKLNTHPVKLGSSNLNSLKTTWELIEKGEKVLIFPEGARSWDGQLVTPFQGGLGLLVSRAQCPILPCYVHGTYPIWPRGTTLPKPWGRTACVFGSPIPWSEFSDLGKKEKREAIRERTEGAIRKLEAWYLEGVQGSPP